MDRPCNESIRKTLRLTEQMMRVADEGDIHREDVGCGVLYGILRDSAYKIRQLAKQERSAHMRKGWWHSAAPANPGAANDPCDDNEICREQDEPT